MSLGRLPAIAGALGLLCIWPVVSLALDSIDNKTLNRAQQAIQEVATSPEKLSVFCVWFREQAFVIEAIHRGDAAGIEIHGRASNAAYAKLGASFAEAHRLSSLAYIERRQGRAKALFDAYHRLTLMCPKAGAALFTMYPG